MKMTKMIKTILSSLLVIVLIAALSVSMMACKEKNGAGDTSSVASVNEETASKVGEGATEFAFRVTDKDGNSTDFIVCTDKEMLGAALLDAGLIEGEESEFGLYIKKVNGIVADYNIDQTYWALLVDGEYSNYGADSVKIETGKVYELKVSK